MNQALQNVEAIDLIDETQNKVIIQVSATASKQKIEGALSKQSLKNYPGYTFKFISISKESKKLRSQTFENPFGLHFDPRNDIYDVQSILNHILELPALDQRPIYDFIKSELGEEASTPRITSNLATLINTLSNEEWDDSNKVENINPFEIERKIEYNNLLKTDSIIRDHALFHDRINSIYREFDTLGSNKSNSVLAKIKREFLKVFDPSAPDESFQKTVEALVNQAIESINYEEIPIDELEFCVEILAVDAFIRCKIFKNPKDYQYASS